MEDLSVSEAQEQFSALFKRVAFGKQRIGITRDGKRIAGIVPIEDLKWLEEAEYLAALEDRAIARARTPMGYPVTPAEMEEIAAAADACDASPVMERIIAKHRDG